VKIEGDLHNHLLGRNALYNSIYISDFRKMGFFLRLYEINTHTTYQHTRHFVLTSHEPFLDLLCESKNSDS